MAYLEILPEGCPPPEAHEVKTSREVLRLVSANPPTLEDFKSEGAKNPGKRYRDECRASGLSVVLSREDCDTLLKLPTQTGKMVCSVTLTAGAGSIQKTSTTLRPTHHTWWPFAEFDILGHSNVITS
jgi:hypothetical protein